MVAAAEEKMIRHYHGTPVWGAQSKVLRTAITGAGAFVSFARPDQVKQCFDFADKVAFDNGAFSAWKQGISINWDAFYKWVWQWYWHPKLEFFVIPDTVEGGEKENDELINKLPRAIREKAAPVWHLHESLDRLKHLAGQWPRICLGSSGEFAAIRTERWHRRMDQAFEIISGVRNPPMVHGLRMLDGRVMGNYPLTTADSTNLACNVPKTDKKYPELTRQFRSIGCNEDQVKINRCAVLKAQIEKIEPPPLTEWARQKGFYVPRNFKAKKEETMVPKIKRVRRSAQPTAAPSEYSIIYADPPWSYDDKAKNRGGAERHYLTTGDQELASMRIPAAKDAVMFMWATFPKIQDAIHLIQAWGFEYRTVAFVWVKANKKQTDSPFWGMGQWTRANAEVCLIGVRGKPQRHGKGVHQLIVEPEIITDPVMQHSRKPAVVREKIVELMGDLPRLEMFAREATAGWQVFGNEAPGSITLPVKRVRRSQQ